jgi:hypothetical protein
MTAPAVNTTVTVPGAYVLPLALIALTLANGFFNSIASAFGAAFPYDTFCFSAGDLLADFIKSAVSFPGPAIRSLDHWPPLYRDYVANNPYGGAAALAEGKLSNLHGMPLPTFILLEARRALAFGGIYAVTAGFFAGAIAPFAALIWFYCRRQGGAAALCALAFLLSYPLIFAVTRGNITALLLGLSLVGAVLLIHEGRSPWLVALLLAVAINLRPNAMIFLALPLLHGSFRQTVAWGFASLAMAAAIFAGALALAHQLYPDYTFAHFTQAVLVYRQTYALGDAGLAYGSSLLGGLKFVNILLGSFVATPRLELASSLLGVVALGIWLSLVLSGRLGKRAGLFCFLALYALFSGVFGDYHLIVFIALVAIFVRDGRNPLANWRNDDFVIAAAALLVLAPKNYLFFGGLSAQILVNPLILTAALLVVAFRNLRQKPGMAPSWP